jgi:Ca2+-binding RTX toxin-like protein
MVPRVVGDELREGLIMKRLRPLLTVAALLFPVTTGVAFAQNGPQVQPRTTAVTGNVFSNVVTCTGGRCEGTDDKDTLVALNKADWISGGGGDDDIELDAFFLTGSSDVGIGGPGRDCIDGGGGNDLMLGGAGDDNRTCEFAAFVDPKAALTGGPGNDRIDGGPGNDSMNGIFDDDTLIGGTGNDLLEDASPSDNDRLFGGQGSDRLDARDGDSHDLLDGGAGIDDCSGDMKDRFVNCENIHRL